MWIQFRNIEANISMWQLDSIEMELYDEDWKFLDVVQLDRKEVSEACVDYVYNNLDCFITKK